MTLNLRVGKWDVCFSGTGTLNESQSSALKTDNRVNLQASAEPNRLALVASEPGARLVERALGHRVVLWVAICVVVQG